MFWVYILQSELDGTYYIGSTKNIETRLYKHNTAQSMATKRKRPWRLVYQEAFGSRGEAIKRELKIKSYKGGKSFQTLVTKTSG